MTMSLTCSVLVTHRHTVVHRRSFRLAELLSHHVTGCCAGTYVWQGHSITAAVAFPSLAFFDQLRFPIIMLPMQVMNFIAAHVALHRMQSFLNAEEVQEAVQGSLSFISFLYFWVFPLLLSFIYFLYLLPLFLGAAASASMTPGGRGAERKRGLFPRCRNIASCFASWLPPHAACFWSCWHEVWGVRWPV